jgi:hypothetical protein
MSCTKRGFLKTIGAAMVGLGLTRLEPLRTFASSSTRTGSLGLSGGGPASGPYSIDSLRALAVASARHAGDTGLASELQDVCCWAPAATAIRSRPLALQERGAEYFFRDFPGGDQLATIMVQTNNTSWRTPRFRANPDRLVADHYHSLQRPSWGLRTQVLTPGQLNGRAAAAKLGLVLDRATGERLAVAANRAEPMWAALSIFTGMLLDPTDELSRRLSPALSLTRAADRALTRAATVRYSQVVIGAIQRAVWADLLEGENAALPLVRLSAAGYLPLGEEDGEFLLLNVGGRSHLTGYRTASV